MKSKPFAGKCNSILVLLVFVEDGFASELICALALSVGYTVGLAEVEGRGGNSGPDSAIQEDLGDEGMAAGVNTVALIHLR